MKKAVTILSLMFVFVCFACSSQVFSQSIEPSGKEAKDLVQFVKEATSLVEKQGETAFVEFKKKNSKWQKKFRKFTKKRRQETCF